MKPTAFADLKTNLWVMDDVVAVLKLEHAEIVFSQIHSFVGEGLKVYGIKGTTANLLRSYADAMEFFLDVELGKK